jgi:hypothetical protein
MTARELDIKIELQSTTLGAPSVLSHGVLLGEGPTAESALANLTAEAQVKAGEIVYAQYRSDKSVNMHASHPRASWTRRFNLSTIRLAAGHLTNGTLGWVAYGSFIEEDHGGVRCPYCNSRPRPSQPRY